MSGLNTGASLPAPDPSAVPHLVQGAKAMWGDDAAAGCEAWGREALHPQLKANWLAAAAILRGDGNAMIHDDKTRLVQCPRCEGYGVEPGAPNDIEDGLPLCGICGGTGEITAAQARLLALDDGDEGQGP